MQAEEDLLLWCESRFDGCVERVHDRRGQPEVANDDVGEFAIERSLGRQSGGKAPLATLDQIERGVIGRKTLGWTGECVAFKFAKCASHFWVLE